MNYSWLWVQCAWQVLLTCIYHLSVITREYYVHNRTHSSIMRTTGFTHEYYAHDRIYSQVFSYYSRVQKCTTGVTDVYFQISHEQCASRVTWVVFKISQGTKHYMHFFVNLDVSCTVCKDLNRICVIRNSSFIFVYAALFNIRLFKLWSTIHFTSIMNSLHVWVSDFGKM